MNFVDGKIISDAECDSVLERIDELVTDTLRKPPLDVNLVINACDTLVKNIDGAEVVKRLPELGVSPVLAEMYMKQISQMFGAEAIRERMRIELGGNYSHST